MEYLVAFGIIIALIYFFKPSNSNQAIPSNIKITNNLSETPLHVAAREGDVEEIKELIKYGADIEARTEKEMTPFHIVAYLGNIKAIIALLKAGANIEARDARGTPLHAAIIGNKLIAINF